MSQPVCYTVSCTFSPEAAASVAEDWVQWLRDEHLQDVLNGGADSAEIVELDGEPRTYEVRYRFPGRLEFEAYLADYAPRLRDEGLRRFPLELGLSYARTVGQSVGCLTVSEARE